MAHVSFQVQTRIQAPADRVWATLGDFGHEHLWTKSVKSCQRDTPDVRVGTTRTCQLPRPLMGRTEARETLTEYEPERALAYVLDGPAGPFARAESRWSVEPAGDHDSVVRIEGKFTPKNWAARWLLWPIARPAIARLSRGVLRELAEHVEVQGRAG